MKKLTLYLLLASALGLTTCDSDIVEPGEGPNLPDRFYPPDQIFGFDLFALGIGEMDLDSIPGDTLYYIDPSSSKVRGTSELDLKKRGSDIDDPDFILSPEKLTNLDGLQFFVNLESIALASNNVTNLPLDSLSRLTSVTMSFNRVKDLIVTGNPALEDLQYTGSGQANPNTEKISDIDLTQNPALRVLSLPSHQIVTIDVSQNGALEEINLESNPGPDGDPNTPDIEIDSFIYDQIEPDKRLGVSRQGTTPPPSGGDRFYPPDQIFGFDLHALGIGEMDTDSIPGDTLYYIEPESGNVTSTTILDLKKRGSDIDDPDFILSPEKLTNLNGLQFFTSLEDLSLTSNNITNLPLDGSPNLISLSMTFNRVKDLDVTSNTALETLNYGSSSSADPSTERIVNIDLTQNAALKVLALKDHEIVTIDLSQNTALEEVDLTGNPGPDGDPETPDIEIPAEIYDQIDLDKRLGVSRGGETGPVDRYYLPDQIFGFDLHALGIGEMDTDSIPGDTLYFIEPESDAVTGTTTLDLKKRGSDIDDPDFILSPEKLTNLDGLQFFTSLEDLSLTSNSITNLPLDSSPNLISLSMTFNRVKDLDVTSNTALETLNYGSSSNADPDTERIETIDLTQNSSLKVLILNDHQIVTIDVTQNTALEEIDLSGNPGPDGDPDTPDIVIPAAIYDQIDPDKRNGVTRAE